MLGKVSSDFNLTKLIGITVTGSTDLGHMIRHKIEIFRDEIMREFDMQDHDRL